MSDPQTHLADSPASTSNPPLPIPGAAQPGPPPMFNPPAPPPPLQAHVRGSHSPYTEEYVSGAEGPARAPSGMPRRQSPGNGYPRQPSGDGGGAWNGGYGGPGGYTGRRDPTSTGIDVGPQSRRERFDNTAQTSGPPTVSDRLGPTIDAATSERNKALRSAEINKYVLNLAVGLQVLLGALTTAIGAALTGKQTSVAISILGGASTLVASFLARARGSNEPETSLLRARTLDHFLREIEAFKLDHGSEVGHDAEIEAFRSGFEALLGNQRGVGAAAKEEARAQAQSFVNGYFQPGKPTNGMPEKGVGMV